MALTNCSECGRLYNKTTQDICDQCRHDLERDFEVVYEFLKDHGSANVDVIHEKTKVKKKWIMKFIAENRFQTVTVSYKCESCGQEITSGRLCEKCLTHLKKGISELTKKELPSRKDTQTEHWTSLDRYQRK